MRKLVFILFILVTSSLEFEGQVMRIGVFRDYKIRHFLFEYFDGDYSIYGDTDEVLTIKKGGIVRVKNENGKVVLKRGEELIGVYKELRFFAIQDTSAFTIKSLTPSLSKRTYEGELTVLPEGSGLKLINNVDLDSYLVGVIESESGNLESKEYYKVQAVISRTYALKHQDKFAHEGFMLTDLTNCQVYLGKYFRNPKIIDAVRETHNLVLVDDDMDYITASFFSNSGGQTVNSEDVWNKALPYLRSVKDPFSKGKMNYNWTKTIPKDKWLSYLERKGYPVDDTSALRKALDFSQEIRHKYFVDWKYHIHLTEIREDWRLKSTYFDVVDKGDYVILEGKGFGHGVGLSQEGAMNMCDMGYGFEDVLKFYYTQAHLINLEMRSFYLDE